MKTFAVANLFAYSLRENPEEIFDYKLIVVQIAAETRGQAVVLGKAEAEKQLDPTSRGWPLRCCRLIEIT